MDYNFGIINHLKNIVITIKIQILKSNKASYVNTTKFSISFTIVKMIELVASAILEVIYLNTRRS